MQKHRFLFAAAIVALAMFTAACSPVQPEAVPTIPTEQATPAPTAAPIGEAAALSEGQLRNASYSGIYTETVTLTDGVYEGEPFVEGGASRPRVEFVDGSTILGDLDGDGVDDAVVLLVESSGGSGTFTYAAAQLNQAGEPVDAGSVWLGDRTQVAAMSIEDGQVLVDIVTQGPDDPQCCPTSKVRKTLALVEGMLAEVGAEEMGTVSLADLDGTSWTLLHLNPDQPALSDTEITLVFEGDQVGGSAGCNSYSGSVSGESAQSLTFGPLASTMMACPDPIMNQETAYLAALQSATQWGYQAGNLVILYQTEAGDLGTLLYAPADQGTAE